MTADQVSQSGAGPGRLAFLLRSYFPALAEPRTDILDLAAVAMGEGEVACLSVLPGALQEPFFRRLVAVGMGCGVAVSDLNGNIGLPAEYQAGRATGQVAVWLACRDHRRLHQLVEAHARLQPQGFAAWAAHLGRELGYPECCVRSYVAAVRSPADRSRFWEQRSAQARARGEVLIGFAPCHAGCRAAQQETIRRLAIARRLGLLEERPALAWLLEVGRADAWHALSSLPVLVDCAETFAPFRVPVTSA